MVWQDDRHGNWDIYGYNLATQEEFQIAGTPRIEVHPAIYKDGICAGTLFVFLVLVGGLSRELKGK